MTTLIDREGIARTYESIRPYIRRTPVIEVDSKDFGLDCAAATKQQRIRELGAELVIAGDRYDHALTASREFVAKSGALAIHAFDQHETLLGQGSRYAPPSARCGRCCAWYPNPAARPLCRRLPVAPIGRRRVNALRCCCVAAIRMR